MGPSVMNPRNQPSNEEIESAIAWVLEAERAAQNSIEATAGQLGGRVAQSRERARLILETAERRILAVRRAVEMRIAERESGINAAIRRLRDDDEPAVASPDHFTRALDIVAAALTSGKQA